MANVSKLDSMAYSTQRLVVTIVVTASATSEASVELLPAIVGLLSPVVVQALPPYFHGIDSNDKASNWLETMLEESHLYSISRNDSKELIGFMFLSDSENQEAHLGYLLGESYWGQGYGSELLRGLLATLTTNAALNKLIAGVDDSNVASAKLLEKVGFTAVPKKQDQAEGVVFYEFNFLE